ncbi:MAG: winged helix-turn-helix transcriptional regulator [Candidatus Thorarchaeota archaeon]|jgi:DNA-binding Lrp family transcriptional regulator
MSGFIITVSGKQRFASGFDRRLENNLPSNDDPSTFSIPIHDKKSSIEVLQLSTPNSGENLSKEESSDSSNSFLDADNEAFRYNILTRMLSNRSKSSLAIFHLSSTEYCMFIVSTGSVVDERREISENQPLKIRIQAYIERNPGAHLREIKRNLDCAMGGLQYQLIQLENEGIIKYMVEGNSKHYFIEEFSDNVQILLITIHTRNEVASEIIWSCITEKGQTRAELARDLGHDISAISYYVKKLLDLDILKTIPVFGREKPLGVTDWALDILLDYNLP